jgi:nucleotide-binding universal stress UspA family protein
MQLKAILHPTDFSASAQAALAVAASLARDHRARLVLLFVSPPPVSSGDIFMPFPEEDYETRARRQFWLLQTNDPSFSKLEVDALVAEGDPAREILRAAKNVGADLIVMGSHGRTGIARVLLGSVAEAVLRRAECPVLTVKAMPALAHFEPEVPARPARSVPR